MRCTVEPGEQCAYLSPSPKPGKVKMRTNDAQGMPLDHQIGQHRTTRLQCGQRDNFAVPYVDPATDQQGIAMPAYALRASANFYGPICPLFEQHMVRNGTQPVAETAVRLL